MGVITLLLAAGLLIVFGYVAWKTATTAGQPPRLADPAPSTAPTLATGAKDYPPQFRSGYDSNARLLALLAIVSPLLTTIVGFYFGKHAGEAGARVVQAQAERDKTQIASVVGQKDPDLLNELTWRGLIKR